MKKRKSLVVSLLRVKSKSHVMHISQRPKRKFKGREQRCPINMHFIAGRHHKQIDPFKNMGTSIFLLRLILSFFLLFTFFLEAVHGTKKASKLLLLITHSSDTKIVAQNYDDDFVCDVAEFPIIIIGVIFHKCLILFAVLHRILGNTLSCFQPYFS